MIEVDVAVRGAVVECTVTERAGLADHAVLSRDLEAGDARVECRTDNALIGEAAGRAADAAAMASIGVVNLFIRPQVTGANTDERRDRRVDTELLQVNVIQDIDEAAVGGVLAIAGRGVAGGTTNRTATNVGAQVGAFNFSAQAVAEAPAEGGITRPARLVADGLMGPVGADMSMLGLGQVITAARSTYGPVMVVAEATAGTAAISVVASNAVRRRIIFVLNVSSVSTCPPTIRRTGPARCLKTV